MYKIISDKNINQPFVIVVWIIVFSLLCFLLGLNHWINKLSVIIALAISGMVAFGDKANVEILTRTQLLFLGQETGVWLQPGPYYLFWIFTLAVSETIKDERKDTVVTSVKCQDQNGMVLLAEFNGDWAIIDTDVARRKYELQDAGLMKTNLESLARRTLIRVIGTLEYKTHILGQDLGDKVKNDLIFKRECEHTYGIVYTNAIADAISANMDQEAINAYYRALMIEERAKYPNNHQFTHAELQDIEANIQVKLNKAKKIITNSPLLGRFEADRI